MSKELDKVVQALTGVSQSLKILDSGPSRYYFEKLNGYIETLFDRFCPFKVGDKVVMTKDYIIPKGSGWTGYDKMMVKGAKATVSNVDCYKGRFEVDVVFDNEFYEYTDWRDVNKIITYTREDKDKHTFNFDEDYWVVVNE